MADIAVEKLNRISHTQLYDSSDGKLKQTLKGHRDLVYCLSYSRDGELCYASRGDAFLMLCAYP